MQRIYGPGFGLLTIAQPKHAPTQPQLAALPSQSAPTPRRRRTIVCNNLTVDGRRYDLAGVQELSQSKRLTITLRGDEKYGLRCAKRPGVALGSDWALDMCLSSWCRNCPFLGS